MPEKTARGGINACEPPFLKALEDLGVGVTEAIYTFDNDANLSILKRFGQVIRTARSFRRMLRNEQFDVLHLNTSFDRRALLRDSFTLFVLRAGGTKIFLKFHGSDIDFLNSAGAFSRILIRWLVKNSDAIGLLSAEELRGFTEFGLAEEKFVVVKNALTDTSRDVVPTKPITTNRPFKLLFVSRLIPTKGLAETVSAVAILRQNGHDATLDVLGDGEARRVAAELAGELNIEESVFFHGHVGEEIVQKFYRESDALVFPTFHGEGFPMVIFNALRFGLSVVTTKIRAAADLLRDGENCLFCEAKNAGSVAEKVAELIGDADLRERMRDANVELAETFLPAKIAAEYLAVYEGLRDRRG